jgi:hypothetical protein
MKVIQVLVALVVIWALSVGTVFLISGWEPVQAAFEYVGDNAVLKAGSALGGVVVLLLVGAYVFGRIAEALGLASTVKMLTNLSRLLR